jgi:ATP-dependent helicase/nuclease subunit A
LTGLNAEQQQAVTAQGHVRVMAGPGTGKTEVIARRYVWLWQHLQVQHPEADADWLESQLLVVTFTNKSAQEMKHRISDRLSQCLDRPVQLTGRWIGTFHAICQQWLAQWNQLPELLTDLQQFRLDQRLMEQLTSTGVDDISPALGTLAPTIPADSLSLPRLMALPLLDVMPFIQDLPKLVQRIQATGLSPAGFYHAAMAQTQAYSSFIKACPTYYPRTNEPFTNAYDAMEVWQRYVTPYASPHWQLPPVDDAATASEVFKPLKPLKDALLSKQDRKTKAYEPADPVAFHQRLDAQTEVEIQLMTVVTAFYAWRLFTLHQNNQCDYDGLIQAVLTAWDTRPDWFTRCVMTQFAGVIVDEFQDTNPAQSSLLAALQPRLGLMVVGDRKQSIYGFRFAEPDNMDAVFAGKQPVTTVSLVTNYRSVPGVVAVANTFAKHLDTTPPLLPYRASTGRPAFEQLDWDDGKLLQQRQQEVSHLIAALQQAKRHADWCDMAILCQKNHRAMALFTQLSQQGIPARLQKISGLMAQPVILDAMAMVQVLMHMAVPTVTPDDALTLAWVRLLQHDVNDADLYALSQHIKPLSWPMGILSLYHQHQLPAPVQTLVSALLAAADNLDAAVLLARVEQVMETTRWMERYAPHKLQLEAFAHWQFVAEQASKTAESLTDVWQTFTYYTNYPHLLPDMPENGENAVSILTAHAAKGLEFPVVFMAWTDGVTRLKSSTSTVMFEPQNTSAPGMGLILRQWQGEKTLKAELAELLWQKPRLDAEQQRLFYVGLTRAKDALTLYRSGQSPAWTDMAFRVDV